ncbi:MAG: pyridoxal phosphate-dependent aminotransferase [Betaproteobacteria bacterium]|nr:MAG: pyridoxal phosphate-dependent aminotransferase [Betaproteobacteria bacterium]
MMTSAENRVSRSVSDVSLSAIKEMAMLSARAEGAVSLAWGLPSFRTPEHIRAAVAGALANDQDVGKYTLPNGLPELRALVASHHREKVGVEVDPERNVLITAGNMQGMNSLFRTLIDPGDEILVTDPGFASHFQQIRLNGGMPIPWRLEEQSGWGLMVDALPKLITTRTKAIVLVTPSNPTGTIFSQDDLLRVGAIAKEYGLTLLVDDPYSNIIYETRQDFFDWVSRGELDEHLAYLFTFSKSHAMSGWRLGYMIVPDWLRTQVLKVHDANLICAPRISQIAAMAALSGSDDHVREFRTILARRRELICERLNRVPHVFEYVRPEGAYYVFPRVVADHKDSREFSLRLLNDALVTVTPGSAFGPTGEHHVRMAFCVDEDVIDTAFDRIERYFPA